MKENDNCCKDCCNCDGIKPIKLMKLDNYQAVECRMFPNRLFTEADVKANGCKYYNKDMSEEKICGNCKYYLGGGDWGLSCGKDYYKLPQATSKACKDFESKKNED